MGHRNGQDDVPGLRGLINAGRRLARAVATWPANLVLFDVLADAGDDLTTRRQRRRFETESSNVVVGQVPMAVLRGVATTAIKAICSPPGKPAPAWSLPRSPWMRSPKKLWRSRRQVVAVAALLGPTRCVVAGT